MLSVHYLNLAAASPTVLCLHSSAATAATIITLKYVTKFSEGMTKEVLLAKPRGFCAGVERAVEAVEKTLDTYGKPVYVKHQIVHNSHVVSSLAEKGAVFVESLEEVPEGSTVVFSAHGSPPNAYKEAAARGLKVIDATCPLVTKVHFEAKKYANEGYTILLVGHRNHVEIIGTSGEAPEATRIIETAEDAQKVELVNPEKVICLTQTTLSIDDTKRIIDVLKQRFPLLQFPPKEDICYATQNRQNAVKELAKHAELILVIGSRNSSNSNRLVEVAKEAGAKAHLINDHSEINPEWLEGVKAVGLTSGASAPDYLVSDVISRLKGLGVAEVTELQAVEENVRFVLPKI